eukprot:4665272-Pyramimonas_sp.AAC.4
MAMQRSRRGLEPKGTRCAAIGLVAAKLPAASSPATRVRGLVRRMRVGWRSSLRKLGQVRRFADARDRAPMPVAMQPVQRGLGLRAGCDAAGQVLAVAWLRARCPLLFL